MMRQFQSSPRRANGSLNASYQVTALIGEGGMGQVYQATDTKLGAVGGVFVGSVMIAATRHRMRSTPRAVATRAVASLTTRE